MRLIDADAFFNDFPEMRDYEYASQEYEVDAAEVVRCKDCIHWYREYGENKCLEFADIPLEPNDFCSHGERRKDVKTD